MSYRFDYSQSGAIFATLGSSLDFESKLGYDEPQLDQTSDLTQPCSTEIWYKNEVIKDIWDKGIGNICLGDIFVK